MPRSAVPLLRAWDRLTLVALPTAVSCARAFAACTLRWWGAAHVMDDALLVVSELVTNAVKATGPRTPTPTWTDVTAQHILGVQLRVDGLSLYVEVWDSGREVIAAGAPTLDDEGGRGLLIVQTLATRWGTYRPPAGGKIVWAELALSAEPALARRVLPLRVPPHIRVPVGKAKEQVETALMQRVLDGLRALD
ncbi:ATP-binding protein [Streptomyces sp. NPDC057137]|uniref:ATP-binding protein n=1 Tax=Streptomyces sp. NPDC057137 TaxID=3346030 RepID=UPI003627404E